MFDRRGRVIAIEMRAMDESRTLDKWEVSLKDLKLVVHESSSSIKSQGVFSNDTLAVNTTFETFKNSKFQSNRVLP